MHLWITGDRWGRWEVGVTVSGAQSGPTALRIVLGGHLRRMRLAAGISRADAGWEIRASESKISRMELGRVGLRERDVSDLLALYGLDDDEERDRLLGLAREANNPGWWHRFGDVLPNWFQSYIDLEGNAELIRLYDLQLIPGLLQTPDYIRAVVQLGRGSVPTEEVERRVALRTRRQEALTRPEPIRLWAVIDEAALRRPVGGISCIVDQLDHLLKASEMPNVTLQVAPFSLGGHAAQAGAFTILRFREADLPDKVYIEHLTSALYLDTPAELDDYTAAMEALCVAAPQPGKSRDHIARIRKEFES